VDFNKGRANALKVEARIMKKIQDKFNNDYSFVFPTCFNALPLDATINIGIEDVLNNEMLENMEKFINEKINIININYDEDFKVSCESVDCVHQYNITKVIDFINATH